MLSPVEVVVASGAGGVARLLRQEGRAFLLHSNNADLDWRQVDDSGDVRRRGGEAVTCECVASGGEGSAEADGELGVTVACVLADASTAVA